MKIRTLILCLMCLMLLFACGKGDAASVENEAKPAVTETAVADASTPEPQPQNVQQVIISAATSVPTEAPVTHEPTPEPTPGPTPEPTATPVPKLGVLDGKFADKFVTGGPVLTENSYQTETLAIFITHVVDDSKTITDHTYQYFMADVYFQNMEDFQSGAAKTWAYSDRWATESLVTIAKKHDAIFAVSGDFTLTREKGLIIRNGEEIKGKNGSTHQHDPARDVGVIYRDGHMETFIAQNTPEEEILNDPEVWQVLGFGPALLDENGQPMTTYNDPNGVSRANIRNVVGYCEPGHYLFVYVPPYKVRQDRTCLDFDSLSKLMCSLGCVRAYNLDGGATAGMYFNGKQVIGNGLGQNRKNQDIYYIPKA